MRRLAVFFVCLATAGFVNLLIFSIWASCHLTTFNKTRQQTVISSSSTSNQTRQKTVFSSSTSNQRLFHIKSAGSSMTPNQTPTRRVIIDRPSVFGATRHYKSLKDDGLVTLRCSSCAVVSNSGTVLGKGLGKEIDSHSCVIRMNMAPVKGYQNDVGNKTSLRVMNFSMFYVNASELPPGSQVMVWGLFPRKPHLENAMRLMKELSAGSVIYGQTLQGETEADELFAKETGRPLRKTNSWISTGWFTLMIAFDICQDTHVYGMVPSYYCTMNGTADVPYHYYDHPETKQCETYKNAETNSTGAHRFITEKAVFASWASRKYNLSFHLPEWTIGRDNLSRLDTPFVRSSFTQRDHSSLKNASTVN